MDKCTITGPKYDTVDGNKFPPQFPPENIRSALNYEPKSNDLFVVSNMKSGSTWTQQICTLILSDGEVTSESKENVLIQLNPLFEWVGAKHIASIPEPKIIKSHLPFDLMPYNSNARYIYIARNPKDVLVSLYYHVRLFHAFEFNGTVHDLLPFFIKGEIGYGSYAHNVLSWWEHRNDSNVLFLLYEDMKTDIRDAICKIAAFMGDEYKRKLNSNSKILENIVNHCDFSFMKQTTNKYLERECLEFGLVDKGRDFNFIRKGIVGDWKNELTVADNETIEKWFEHSFRNTGVYNLWDKYSIFQHKLV